MLGSHTAVAYHIANTAGWLVVPSVEWLLTSCAHERVMLAAPVVADSGVLWPLEEARVTTVRAATFEVLRSCGMTTIFSNPGSTEVSFLTDLPEDIRFVLALHEGSVVGMATGWSIATGALPLVVLHTTAGLGNAVGALATARVNRAPMVVLVGQQDRRHLALEPFLAGQLRGLAGSYPVWVNEPVRAQDVPGAVARAWLEARHGSGPALVIVPMDDWKAPIDKEATLAAPGALLRPSAVTTDAARELAALIGRARSPALVVGAGADDQSTWDALVDLAERLNCPVWQEPFGARAGFPQDHRLFAGHLPAGRDRLRKALRPYDLVVVIGAPVFRQYPFEAGAFVAAGTRLAVVTADPAEAHRSPVELAILAPPALVCQQLAELVPSRPQESNPDIRRGEPPPPPQPGETMRAAHVLAALASRMPADTVLIEETPSSRQDLQALIPARRPLGFLSAAMGGLGFALPAAIGVRMGRPDRPVVAVVGDGSSLYQIQALWSAVHYACGVLFIVLANGRYAIMDRLAEAHGEGRAPWPDFEEVSVAGLAQALGCPAIRVEKYEVLTALLDETLPALADRKEPLLVEVAVPPDPTFQL